jgi:hypothetical protein
LALIALSTLLVADLDSDAPNTAIVATRASPTIRAEAVCAVRRGLRMEFSRPSLPAIPKTRASGRPITLAIGRATTGASIPIPMKTANAPSPTNSIAGLVRPTTSAATPSRAIAEPMTIRRREDSSSSAR